MFRLSESSHPELVDLISHFQKCTYRASSDEQHSRNILANVANLLNRDYAFVEIKNENGSLCDSYPENIPFLLTEQAVSQSSPDQLQSLLNKCKRARCRNRFVVPVLKFEGKLLCRSATLSGSMEMLYRNGITYLFGANGGIGNQVSPVEVVPGRDSFDQVRGADIYLLNYLEVSHIADLMLEDSKYKYGVRVTSSEKVDKEKRYNNFEVMALPYPGVEHFADWVDNNYDEQGLRFDWNQDFINADIRIPEKTLNHLRQKNIVSLLEIPEQYQSWDTVQLTKSYFKLLLEVFLNNSSGLLIHCISGWDRTPFFVSLIRISLWADGLIHKSLNTAELLYFTIGYDWFLFCHNLVDRGKQRQEIFRYCFSFLRHLEHSDFSAYNIMNRQDPNLAERLNERR